MSFFISSLLAAVSLLWALLADFMIWEMNYRDPGAFFPFAMIDTLMNLGALCLSIILAVLAFIHRTSDGKWIAIPFIISCIALTVKMLGLSTSWWLEYNYSRLDAARSEFARTVAATPPKQSSENFYDNTLSYPHGQMLSIGDGPVYYKITGRGPLLLYVTFEGIPDGLSGFLYVPPGSDPKVTWPELQLDWADKWNTNGSVYFVGNR